MSVINCETCPIGEHNKIGSECSFSVYGECPLEHGLKLMGKSVSYLVYRKWNDDALTIDTGSPMVFQSFDDAVAYVEGQQVVAVEVEWQIGNRDGRTPNTSWYAWDADVFSDQHDATRDFFGGIVDEAEDFDAVFGEDLARGMKPYDVLMAHRTHPQSNYFYHDHMVRWYERDDILDVMLGRFSVDTVPQLDDGRWYGRTIMWLCFPHVLLGYDDEEETLPVTSEVRRNEYSWVIQMVEVR